VRGGGGEGADRPKKSVRSKKCQKNDNNYSNKKNHPYLSTQPLCAARAAASRSTRTCRAFSRVLSLYGMARTSIGGDGGRNPSILGLWRVHTKTKIQTEKKKRSHHVSKMRQKTNKTKHEKEKNKQTNKTKQNQAQQHDSPCTLTLPACRPRAAPPAQRRPPPRPRPPRH
jgi:hypothetical protein